MADGHFQDVEALRRELAILVLEWAGKAVKDDPDGPMSTALARAVADAAREAVAEQHKALNADAADQIAEALDRHAKARGFLVWRLRPWAIAATAVLAALLLGAAFLLGLQTGRAETALPSETATGAAPVAPLAPAVEAPAPSPVAEHEPTSEPAARPQKPTARPTSARALGRPAPSSEETTPRTAQPVGAAPASSPAQTPKP
jgi:hypothetical protein